MSSTLVGLSCGARAHEERQHDPWAAAVESITGEGIRGHMEALAADDMEGREAGTPGFQRAADYVAGQFEEIGLVPLGEDGSYLQPIDFFETRLVPDSATLRLEIAEPSGSTRAVLDLVWRDDFIRYGGYGEAREDIAAALVFVGHGITAPEYGHDDFAGVDARGKIAVVLSGAPPHFATDQRAFYSSGQIKRAAAAGAGAAGLLTVRTPVDQARSPWARYLSGLGSAGMRWLDAEGTPFRGYPELAGSALLSEAGAEKLFALAETDLAEIFEKHAAGETGSFDLGVSATLTRRSEQGRISSANVVGLLEGSDPELRGEYIVYTAHLDHLGIRADAIHNGAYDNAAGVAAVLEVARAMAGRAAPRRSILFVALTAEEKGLLGSSYFARNPPVPAEAIVANLNVDMPYLGFSVADLEAFGVEHSSLADAVRRATEAVGLTLSPDSMPERVRFVRSDQFSFVQQGIPALALKPGSRSFDPVDDGNAMVLDFLSNHYHQASDDLALPYSDEGARNFVRAALLTGRFVADADERPHWNDGDFFALKFAR